MSLFRIPLYIYSKIPSVYTLFYQMYFDITFNMIDHTLFICSPIYVLASLKVSFPHIFPLKLCMLCVCYMSYYHNHLDLRFLVTLGKYNACSSTLCNFLYSPVILSLLAPNIFLSTLVSNIFNLCPISRSERPSFTSIQYNWQYNSFICINF